MALTFTGSALIGMHTTGTADTPHVRVTGGRDGAAVSSDGTLNVLLSDTYGREPGAAGTTPECLFAAAYGACFGSAIEAIARRRNRAIGPVMVEAMVTLNRDDEGNYSLAAHLNVICEERENRDVLVRIVRDADLLCPYSLATAGNIEVQIALNGTAIARGIDRTPV